MIKNKESTIKRYSIYKEKRIKKLLTSENHVDKSDEKVIKIMKKGHNYEGKHE